MQIISPTNIDKAVNALKEGKLVAFPTETVFGIGVIYDNEEAYQKLIDVKRRSPDKPFTLMCADIDEIYHYAIVTKEAQALIDAFVPGQITLILKAQDGLPKWAVSKEGNVGIRISSNEMIRNLIRSVEKPLLVPSANRAGEKPALSANEVKSIFGNEINVIISGATFSNVPSTVVEVTGPVRILREGTITESQITKAIKENV